MKKIISLVAVSALCLAVAAPAAAKEVVGSEYCYCTTNCVPLTGGGQSCVTTCTGCK